ncbi:MAG: hypothetical protein JWO19_1220 [Bryobacterales bacterium]|jgi:hypothetical protein|nr:hypothetical protein [Bryobacterales bacterium]
MMTVAARWLPGVQRPSPPEDVVWALAAVTRRFSGTCLVNAVAAHALLHKHGHSSTVRVGAARKEGAFAAHAWVERDGEIVMGGPQSVIAEYTPFPRWDDFTL